MLLSINKVLIAGLCLVAVLSTTARAQTPVRQVAKDQLSAPTRVAILGTGTPNIRLNRAGTATAIIVDGKQVYLFDAGAGFMDTLARFTKPGKRGIFPPSPLYPDYMLPTFLNKLFLTHLDSDHIFGVPELLLRGWVLGRDKPVRIWGPKGTRHLVKGIIEAYQPDIQHRLETLPISKKDAPYEGKVTEFGPNPGVLYRDKYVTISAFDVHHGSWGPGKAVGYRIEAPDKTIVISGDTSPTDNLIKHAKGADILLHEVMSQAGVDEKPQSWQTYMHSAHTTTTELAAIANKVKPGLLVMIHPLLFGHSGASLVKEVTDAGYKGPVKLANDGDVFE